MSTTKSHNSNLDQELNKKGNRNIYIEEEVRNQLPIHAVLTLYDEKQVEGFMFDFLTDNGLNSINDVLLLNKVELKWKNSLDLNPLISTADTETKELSRSK